MRDAWNRFKGASPLNGRKGFATTINHKYLWLHEQRHSDPLQLQRSFFAQKSRCAGKGRGSSSSRPPTLASTRKLGIRRTPAWTGSWPSSRNSSSRRHAVSPRKKCCRHVCTIGIVYIYERHLQYFGASYVVVSVLCLPVSALGCCRTCRIENIGTQQLLHPPM